MAEAALDTGALNPPSSLELEQALLGAILTNNAAYNRVSSRLRPEHFHIEVHGAIYAACGRLVADGKVASPLTLKAYFDGSRDLEASGGAEYLFDLVDAVITVSGAEDYAGQIIDLWQRREALTACRDAAADLARPDLGRPASEIVTALFSDVDRICKQAGQGERRRRDVLHDLYESMKRPSACHSTGFRLLDRAMGGGLHAGRLYGVMARKKQGKTNLAGSISYQLNERGIRHAYIALEMGDTQIEQRQVARALGFNALRFLDELWRSDVRNQQRVADYAVSAPDNVVYVNRPGMTFDDLRRAVYDLHNREGIGGIFLDYLQLIAREDMRETEASFHGRVAQWLADTAKRLGIWIFVLCQENQDGNVRGGEGIRLACDQMYRLAKDDNTDCAWLSMLDSRYTPFQDVGSESNPSMALNKRVGPYFEEIAE